SFKFHMQFFGNQFQVLKSLNRPFVILVPFYQTRSRHKDGFDVLPYGTLARFGTLVHQEHPIWQRAGFQPTFAKQPLESWFFPILLRYAATSEARIAFLVGSLFEDLMEDVVAYLAKDDWLPESAARDAVNRFWIGLDHDFDDGEYVAVPHLESCRRGEG